MNTVYTHYYKTPLGELILGSFDDQLCLCDWRYRQQRTRIDTRIKTLLQANYLQRSSKIVELAIIQLDEYFKSGRRVFELPILMLGTEFQKKVWYALQNIPYGTTKTYKELSVSMGNPKAIRAIASANGANALSIIIPCHRIIATGNKLGGYAGGLDAKRKLLQLESTVTNNQFTLF